MLEENLIKIYETSFRENREMPALTDYFKGETFSYYEMAKEIAKLHLLFKKAGVKKGDKIALIGRNNPRWCITYIATISYGAVIVPILQDFAPADIIHIINHSESKLLFLGDNFWDIIEEDQIRQIEAVFSLTDFHAIYERNGKALTKFQRDILKNYRSKYPRGFSVNDIKYPEIPNDEVILLNYTSGTTGYSKGVMLTVNNLTGNVSFARGMVNTQTGTHYFVRGGRTLSFLPLAHAYGCAFDFLAPLAVFNILMFIVRLDGAPRFAMACNIMAACINIVLDYLFIFEFGWGLAGAAIATGIGYIVGSGVMLRYMLRSSRTLHFVKFKTSYKSLRLTARNLGYMTYIGFPALLSELAISCLMVVGNYTFIRYTGKDGVAAYSIACYIFPIIFMVYNGIIQSAQPIISYNYGAGLMRRGRDAFAMALGSAFACGLAVFGFTWLFSPWIVGLFLTPDAPAYAIAVRGLPLFAAGYPFFGINVVTIGYYQSIERGRLATGLTVLRGIVLMAFCFLVLPRLAGVAGIWLAVPAAELATTLLLLVLLRLDRGMRRPIPGGISP